MFKIQPLVLIQYGCRCPVFLSDNTALDNLHKLLVCLSDQLTVGVS